MTIDALAQSIASLKGQLQDHIEAEGATMRDLADEVHDSHGMLLELTREIPGIRAQATVLEGRVRKLEMNGGSVRHDPAPLARHPHPSGLELERYGADLTPAGGIRIEQAMWSTIVAAREDTERAISDLRLRLDAGMEDQEREKARREGAEQERQRVANEAEAKEKASNAKTKKWIGIAGGMAPVAVGIWEAAKWLLVHVFHF